MAAAPRPSSATPACELTIGPACNSAEDTYKHNPWRAPGTAPTFDVCGKAGGGIPPKPDGAEGDGPGDPKFASTINAKEGDLGSLVLKKGPSQATWKAGGEVEVTWSMWSNHGGGVQWRLCPAGETLTEACMARTPLPFVGRQYLLYRNGSRQLLRSKYAAASYTAGVSPKYQPNGSKYVTPGTGFYPNGSCPGARGCPVGITWALNPIPDACQAGSKGCAAKVEFQPPCTSTGEIDVPNAKDRTTWRATDLGLCQGERPAPHRPRASPSRRSSARGTAPAS